MQLLSGAEGEFPGKGPSRRSLGLPPPLGNGAADRAGLFSFPPTPHGREHLPALLGSGRSLCPGAASGTLGTENAGFNIPELFPVTHRIHSGLLIRAGQPPGELTMLVLTLERGEAYAGFHGRFSISGLCI